VSNTAEHQSYQHKYALGDRVRGRYQGVPFAGTVMIDNCVNPDDGAFVIVELDLPIRIDGRVMNMIKVTHKDLHGPEEKYEFSRKANKKK
jgi:hypothetical protein